MTFLTLLTTVTGHDTRLTTPTLLDVPHLAITYACCLAQHNTVSTRLTYISVGDSLQQDEQNGVEVLIPNLWLLFTSLLDQRQQRTLSHVRTANKQSSSTCYPRNYLTTLINVIIWKIIN